MAALTRQEVKEILEKHDEESTGFWDSVLNNYDGEDELKTELRARWTRAERMEGGGW